MAGFVKGDVVVIPVDEADFASGRLKQPGNIRPNRLFTADTHIILYRVGHLKAEKLVEVIDKLVGIIKN